MGLVPSLPSPPSTLYAVHRFLHVVYGGLWAPAQLAEGGLAEGVSRHFTNSKKRENTRGMQQDQRQNNSQHGATV